MQKAHGMFFCSLAPAAAGVLCCVGYGCVVWWPTYDGNSGLRMSRWLRHYISTCSQNVVYWSTSTYDGQGMFV